jgi:hypothetical protein
MEGVSYLHLLAGQEPPVMQTDRGFLVILLIEQVAEDEWRSRVGDWLVRTECLYLVAWGHDCEQWHDGVDFAALAAFDFGEIPDDAFVMTTWHADELLSEALWFAAHAASHPTVSLDQTVLIHISPTERSAELIDAFERAKTEQV